MIVRSNRKSRRWQKKTLIAMLAAMAGLVGGSQVLAPASAFAVIDDGGVICPEFLPSCEEQKDEDGKGAEGPTVPNSDGGVIVIVDDVPEPAEEEDPYDPGGRSIGTPPSSPDEDLIASPTGPTGGGARLDRKPRPKKNLSPKQKWAQLSPQKKGEACVALNGKIWDLSRELEALENGGIPPSWENEEEFDYDGNHTVTRKGSWGPSRSPRTAAQVRKERNALKHEFAWKKCGRWYPSNPENEGLEA